MRTAFWSRIFGVFLLMILCLPISAFSAEYILPSTEERECIAYVRVDRWNASNKFSYLVKQEDINEIYAILEIGNQYMTKTIEKVDADDFIQMDCMNQEGQEI